MTDFESVVKTVAPTLATALLGPLGGVAASIAAQAIFGADDKAKAAATPASKTFFDPPLAGAAYNAGSIWPDLAPGNRWKLYCYPEGTGQYLDRLVPCFNDAMRTCRSDGWTNAAPDVPSFGKAFQRTITASDEVASASADVARAG